MRLRILVVDDDKFMRDMLPPLIAASYRDGAAPELETAATPDDALQRIARQSDDEFLVVLSDYNLKAARNGLHVLDAVKRERPDALRILFSGHTREEIGGVDEADLHGFLEKPFRLQEIIAPLRALIERATAGHEAAAPLPDDGRTRESAVRDLGREEVITHLVKATSKGEEGRARTLYQEAERRGEREQADRETARALAAHNRVLELVATGAPLGQTLSVLALAIEEQVPGMLASVHLLDDAGARLVHAAAPNLPEPFRRACDGVPVADGGPAAAAVREKRLVVVGEAGVDARWGTIGSLAASHDLTTGWSAPVIATDGRVFGAVTLYGQEARGPGERELQLLELGSNLARVAIESDRDRHALRASNERYHALFNSIDQGFCIIEVLFDPEGRAYDYIFIEVNAAFEAQTGLQDAAGKRILELQPRLEQHWFDIYGRVALTGEPIRFENHAASMGRWFDLYAFRVGEPAERRVGVLFSDVTRRKQAEREREELREREKAALAETAAARERLRGAILQAPVAMAVLTGADHVTELVNASYEQVTGRNATDLLGRSIREAFPEVGNQFFELLDEVYRSGQPFVGRNLPVTLLREGREDEAFLDFVYQPSRDASGNIEGIIVVVHEVTEQVLARQRAEAAAAERQALLERERLALAEAEAHRARLHDLIMQAPAAIAIVDGADYVFSFANPRYGELMGRPVGELLGRRVVDVLPGVEQQGFIRLLDGVRETGKPFHAEGMAIELPWIGRTLYLNFVYQPVRDREGRVTSILAHAVDVTAQVRAQEQTKELAATLEARVRARTRELEQTNRDLESFSYVVSHDLRAPLRAVHYLVGAALEDLPETLPEVRAHLVTAQRSAEQMARLIEGLLSLARASQADIRFDSVDLTELANGVVDELRLGDPARRVEVVVQDGLRVKGDPRLLRSVMDNLLANAWKFTRERPGARIEVGVTTDSPPTFFVRDNGIGFDPDRAQNLFQPFERLENARAFEGTGIGLATVRRAIERHGGTVWAESKHGEGATFWFTLPAHS